MAIQNLDERKALMTDLIQKGLAPTNLMTKSKTGNTQQLADRRNRQTRFRVQRDGDLLVVRTEGDSGPTFAQITADLIISVPHGLNVESRGSAALMQDTTEELLKLIRS